MKRTDDAVSSTVLTEHMQFSLSLVKVWTIEYEGSSGISVRKNIQEKNLFSTWSALAAGHSQKRKEQEKKGVRWEEKTVNLMVWNCVALNLLF